MFYITISNGLLSPDHRKRMGSAVWEFMWCLDKVTRIDHKGIGHVLGGKPIKLSDIAKTIGGCDDTISRNLKSLEEEKYIEITRTPYGLSIKVNKAKKRFGKNVDSTKMSNLITSDKNVESLRKNVESNKTIQYDKTEDIAEASSALKVFDLRAEIQKLEDNPRRDLNIIALYLAEKKPDIKTAGQFNVALRRHVRAAKELKPFDNDQILKAVAEAKREYPKIWTLETLVKILTK